MGASRGTSQTAGLDRAADRLERLYAAAARGTDGSASASSAVTAALSANLDAPVVAVAETDGGAAARLALSSSAPYGLPRHAGEPRYP